MSEVSSPHFTTYEHIQALQQRNTQELLEILGSSDSPAVDFEPEQNADNSIKSRTAEAMVAVGNAGIQYALQRSGAIAGVDNVRSWLQQNEDRMRMQWEMRHDRIIQKKSGEWLTWTHLRHSANDMAFNVKAYMARNPTAAAVGSKIGGHAAKTIRNIPMFGQFLGPIADRFFPLLFGAAGVAFAGDSRNKYNPPQEMYIEGVPHAIRYREPIHKKTYTGVSDQTIALQNEQFGELNYMQGRYTMWVV
jgi:hypothetical protein